MMKILWVLFLFTANSWVNAYVLRDYDKKPRSSSHLARSIKKYEKDDLIKLLRSFVKETRPTRIIGSQGHFKSVDFVLNYIKENTNKDKELVVVDEFKPDVDQAIKMYQDDFDEMKKSGVKPGSADYKRFENFTNSQVLHLEKLRQQKGRNIIWEKKGSERPNEVIVIGAHYDTVAYDKKSLKMLPEVPQPGADNNGSGVSIALALIEVLSELQIKKTVRVVFFDFQEFGFLGSWDYAKKLKLEKQSGVDIKGFINLVMLGHDSKIKDKAQKYGNMKLYYSSEGTPTYADEKALAKLLTAKGAQAISSVKFKPEAKNFPNGDNVSFIQNGIASLTFTQNWEDDFNGRRIHTSKDFVETLNFKTLYGSFVYITQAVSSWALNL